MSEISQDPDSPYLVRKIEITWPNKERPQFLSYATCKKCGSIVADQACHTKWHEDNPLST